LRNAQRAVGMELEMELSRRKLRRGLPILSGRGKRGGSNHLRQRLYVAARCRRRDVATRCRRAFGSSATRSAPPHTRPRRSTGRRPSTSRAAAGTRTTSSTARGRRSNRSGACWKRSPSKLGLTRQYPGAKVRVVKTKTPSAQPPAGYDLRSSPPSRSPSTS
jgi:hypothetical protein